MCDLGDDVVKLAIPYSDLYYLDLIVCHGRRGGGPRVGNETSRARRRGGCNVSILDIRRDEEVLIPYKSLTLLNGQDRAEGVGRAMTPPGCFRLRINGTLFSFDVLFELSGVLLVVGSGGWCVGVAIGFIDLHVLDVGVVLRVRRSYCTSRVVGGVVVLPVLGAGVVFRLAIGVVLVVVGDLLVASPGWR
jgi:hypothetical protein